MIIFIVQNMKQRGVNEMIESILACIDIVVTVLLLDCILHKGKRR